MSLNCDLPIITIMVAMAPLLCHGHHKKFHISQSTTTEARGGGAMVSLPSEKTYPGYPQDFEGNVRLGALKILFKDQRQQLPCPKKIKILGLHEWLLHWIEWFQLSTLDTSGLTKFDWKVVAQWATKDSTLVAQQWLVVARQCKARNGGIWWHLKGKL